ncbi:MAG: 6-phosphogluconolactonase [Candidatus Methylopumilus sp.]|nr:6-phosphogluconolactonase [Candidatus Methylopumilus sp.]
MSLKNTKWQSFESQVSLDQAAMERVERLAEASIKARGQFHLVLAGGSTPKNVYTLLKNISADWHKWQIYFGDERCLEPNHQERNSTMAFEAWLNHVDIPAQNIHVIPAELGPVEHSWDNSLDTLAVFDAPKPPPLRISMSPARLSRSKSVLFLVSGIEKQTAINQWKAGDAIPASTVSCNDGVDVFCFNVS